MQKYLELVIANYYDCQQFFLSSILPQIESRYEKEGRELPSLDVLLARDPTLKRLSIKMRDLKLKIVNYETQLFDDTF